VSFAKQYLEETENRGFPPTEDAVCLRHICEDFLRARLLPPAEADCSVCGQTDIECVSVDDLMDLVVATLRANWSRAIDGLFLDPEGEFGYGLAHPRPTNDVLAEVLESAVDEELLEFLSGLACDDLWFEARELWLEGEELLVFSWHAFAEWVRGNSLPIDAVLQQTEKQPERSPAADGLSPTEMLPALLQLIADHQLVRSNTSTWYRARRLDSDELPSAGSLGTAPNGKGGVNRFNAQGRPMFYGAADCDTALAEISDFATGVSVGHFAPSRPAKVLDLTDLPDLPSYFDVDQRDLRQAILFLQEFADLVSQPIDASGADVEYRPTQAVAHALFQSVPPLDGILYRSSKTGTACCVLNVEHLSCVVGLPGAILGHDLLLILRSIQMS
jgi:hypothetical protein